jgi:hypothetical protein
MEAKQTPGCDFERYWHAHFEVEEGERLVEDLEERLEWWRNELEKRKRKLARIQSA